jgi:hypothetical protein
VAIRADWVVRLPDGNGSDDVTLRRDGDNLELLDNTTTVLVSRPLASVNSLVIRGTDGEADKLTVDYDHGGFFAVPNGVQFHSGSGSGDELVVQGDGLTGAVLSSSFGPMGEGTLQTSDVTGQNLISFSGVEPLSVLDVIDCDVASRLDVGGSALTIGSADFTSLHDITTLTDGTIAAPAGLYLGPGRVVRGNGEINAPISSDRGSTITMTGDLTLGDAASFDGVDLAGRLNIGANTATLNDGHKAVLGSQTTFGNPGVADGILNAPNGIELPDTCTFVGQGEVNTTGGEFENQGFVQGDGGGITFNHLVTGAGDFGGAVTFLGGTDFGNSPAKIDVLGSATFGQTNTHYVEIGGLMPGYEFDQVVATGTFDISGPLEVVFIDLGNGYTPQAGDSFAIITAASPGPDAPQGAQVSADTSSPGQIVVTFTSPTTPLPSGTSRLITLDATVPGDAPYGAVHVLDVSAVSINAGTIPATADDALHATSYFGDATGNEDYSGLDAQRVARVAVGLDDGFEAYPSIDPVIIADVTGNGALSGLDAQRIAQEAVGLDPDEIPPLPAQGSPLRAAPRRPDNQPVSRQPESGTDFQHLQFHPQEPESSAGLLSVPHSTANFPGLGNVERLAKATIHIVDLAGHLPAVRPEVPASLLAALLDAPHEWEDDFEWWNKLDSDTVDEALASLALVEFAP